MRNYVTVAVIVFIVIMLGCLLLPALSNVGGHADRRYRSNRYKSIANCQASADLG
jgi:NADH:ubiquinone oxidoreductase subunit 3 (subunit A)